MEQVKHVRNCTSGHEASPPNRESCISEPAAVLQRKTTATGVPCTLAGHTKGFCAVNQLLAMRRTDVGDPLNPMLPLLVVNSMALVFGPSMRLFTISNFVRRTLMEDEPAEMW